MRRNVTIIAMSCPTLLLIPAQPHAQSKSQGILLFKEALRLHKKAQTHNDLKQAKGSSGPCRTKDWRGYSFSSNRGPMP